MRFTHTKCGGEIDVKKRQCRRCKKKWDPISFRFDPVGIRAMVDKKGRPLPDRQVKSKPEELDPLARKLMFIFGVPYLDTVISKLPKWPRWARILTTVVIVGLVILAIELIRG